MTGLPSYRKVHYMVRVKKQIERMLFIETFEKLRPLIDISEYHYVGFGSIYYADFILFHKYLHIKRMTSVQYEDANTVADKEKLRQNFHFNKPYGFIDLSISEASDFMKRELNWNDPLLIWLDYDNKLTQDTKYMLDTFQTMASKAKQYDVFMTTIECDIDETAKDAFLRDDDLRMCLPTEHERELLSQNLPSTLNHIIRVNFKKGLESNPDKKLIFLQIFNLTYKDTAKMYTFGSFFLRDEDVDYLKSLCEGIWYISHTKEDVKEIDCPLLTLKEKSYLEGCIHNDWKCHADLNVIGMSDDEIQRFEKVYKYYPQFFEAL